MWRALSGQAFPAPNNTRWYSWVEAYRAIFTSFARLGQLLGDDDYKDGQAGKACSRPALLLSSTCVILLSPLMQLLEGSMERNFTPRVTTSSRTVSSSSVPMRSGAIEGKIFPHGFAIEGKIFPHGRSCPLSLPCSSPPAPASKESGRFSHASLSTRASRTRSSTTSRSS